jgi:tRNA-dihydrouridine synthase
MEKPSVQERVEMMLRHAKMLMAYKGDYIGVREMRKHAAWYTSGYPNSAKLRGRINEVDSYEGLRALFEEVLERG